MALEALVGNEKLRPMVERLLKSRSFPHAVIISGPAGSGKRTLAEGILQGLVCTGEAPPCRRCAACHKFAAGGHPDVTRIAPEGRDIAVGPIRQIRSDAYVRPNEADYKATLICDADTMNLHAQNALLRILEEPPSYCVFVLLCKSAQALLPTIRSRCVQYTMHPVGHKLCIDWLAARFPGRAREQLDRAARLSGGYLGQAVNILENESSSRVQEMSARYLSSLQQKNEIDLYTRSAELERLGREELSAFLDALRQEIHLRLIEAQPAERPRLADLSSEVAAVRSMCDTNMGGAHIAGLLAVKTWRAAGN